MRGPHAELIDLVSTGHRRSTVSKVTFFILATKRREKVNEGSDSELMGATPSKLIETSRGEISLLGREGRDCFEGTIEN
jgi:hypothetical protein